MDSPQKHTEELRSLRVLVEQLQRQLSDVQDIQAIQWLLNHYTALHDDACFDPLKRQEWEELFAEDGIAVYPFGQHKGRTGKGQWAFTSVQYFERCQLLSSNFDISFTRDKKKAYVRTNCIAQWLKNKEVHHDHFDEGGFYNWVLRKEADGKWYIERVQLTIQWTTGEDPTGVGPSSHGTPRL